MKHFVSHRGNFSFKPLKLQFPLMETKVSRLECTVLDLVDNFVCYT